MKKYPHFRYAEFRKEVVKVKCYKVVTTNFPEKIENVFHLAKLLTHSSNAKH